MYVIPHVPGVTFHHLLSVAADVIVDAAQSTKYMLSNTG